MSDRSADETTHPQSLVPYWPTGASETYVRECNCQWCQALVDALERARDGVAVDGEHRHLGTFGEGTA